MQLTPVIAIHLTAAVLATAIGPLALWARKGRLPRPRLHRAAGYAWVTLMLLTALSAVFIDATVVRLVGSFGVIHLLIPVTLGALGAAFWWLFKGNVSGHRKSMQNLYIGACLVAGAFTLLPDRFLSSLVWSQWLGLM